MNTTIAKESVPVWSSHKQIPQWNDKRDLDKQSRPERLDRCKAFKTNSNILNTINLTGRQCGGTKTNVMFSILFEPDHSLSSD